MTLVVFDLDGTLLDKSSKISPYTAETLSLMRARAIPYTVATGRTLQAAVTPLKDHFFTLPLILKNGAIIWSPEEERYSHHHLLAKEEVWHVLAAFTLNDLTPFVFSLRPGQRHVLYHGPLKTQSEHKLADLFEAERHLPLEPLTAMPDEISVINVFALGSAEAVTHVRASIAEEPHLIAYSGVAIHEREMGHAATEPALHWVDIHHSLGSKGNAINRLRSELDIDHVIAFGDGDNDLSMFESASECYAPANADPVILDAADKVIGHHDEDGVARFLRERFNL
ncbi:MAG: HAD family hydrolase [Luminiphilus sp.]|nr:HAD family hydrolase [Luminiphilus sp.]